jgi:ABC-type uncharacterized transport system ATPase subunit
MLAPRATGIEAVAMTMQFGDFVALDRVSMKVAPGSFHALLGENGAGKSTLVKCIMGFHQPKSGELLINGREISIRDPAAAHRLGLGMVYQHFTLAASLSGVENLTIARSDLPARIDWRQERARLQAFMDTMPFRVALDRPVRDLAAGEKQKLEILKQLYLGHRFLILDEPTSVLTPAEADETLGHIRRLTEAGELSVLMISHKFREVRAFADDVTVLRRGRLAGGGTVAALTDDDMAAMMMGRARDGAAAGRRGTPGEVVLQLSQVRARDRSGLRQIAVDRLDLRAAEIVGIAGISGNGQVELMEILTGQRRAVSGRVVVDGKDYHGRRRQARRHRVRYLPEEPLLNASAPHLSVAENLALRSYDGNGRQFLVNRRAMNRRAADLIEAYDIRCQSLRTPIRQLSGGNVQRVALARELSGDVRLLIVANPCFGLDFLASRSIRDRLIEARNAGVAVLLISEDLDELLELSDRIMVMSGGSITYETPGATADAAEIGLFMAGKH